MKAPKGTVTHLRPSPKIADMQQTISTMRLLIAVMVRRFGVFDQLTLTPDEIQNAKEGELKIFDNPRGDIVLQIKGVPPRLVVHG
jgi:hypothetical protein